MSRTIIDIHILQTVPPSNLNRDDTGSPKTAVYGGVRRARVSSQAWKRATRKAFNAELDPTELGVRTKRVVELIAGRIADRSPDLEERAEDLAVQTLKAIGITTEKPKKSKKDEDPAAADGAESSEAAAESKYLLFFSARQLDNLAEAAVYAANAEGGVVAGLKEREVRKLADRDHSIDIALFGRMVADATDINVDAAAQVAHAISVHKVENDFDYYTAVDDRKDEVDETGAGMIGTVEFNSATLYRYATVDVDRLRENLGDDEATRRAVEAFVRTFSTSMPTGKQNTFGNRTLPDAILVRARETQPISFVGAFEEPVGSGSHHGLVKEASDRLARYTGDVESVYDEQPLESWVVHVGDRTAALADLGREVSLAELVKGVGDLVAARLTEAS